MLLFLSYRSKVVFFFCFPPGKGLLFSGAGSGLINRVAETTMSSVESVMTILDPQMKEFLHTGGDLYVTVASDKEAKLEPIREAFYVRREKKSS